MLNNRITGSEVLLRWHHPEFGNIPPDEFIYIAGKSGFICDLGEWVLEQALKSCRHWIDLGFKTMSVSVNVSSIQFKRGQFDLIVKSLINHYGLEVKNLILEITESLLLDVQQDLEKCVAAIRKLGIRLAIDDFGPVIQT